MNLLTNRIAVIIGGTSCIGVAAVELFAKRGAKVLFTGSNVDEGKKIETRLSAEKAEVAFFRCNITSLQEIDRLKAYCERKFGKIDILFNNAGMMSEIKDIDRASVEDWEETFDVNVTGVFRIIRALKDLIFKSQGCIINNAPVTGMHSYVTGKSYVYSASKSSLIQFTRQLAKNYARYGVRVNCICSGIIDTPILGNRDRSEYAKRIPLGYIGKPEEVAYAVAFLASDDAKYITGCVLPVDEVHSRISQFNSAESQLVRNTVPESVYNDLISNGDWHQLMDLRNNNVYVTGATGFIGYYLVLYLLTLNDEMDLGLNIILSVRNVDKAYDLYRRFLGRKDVYLAIDNLSKDIICIDGCDVDIIFHLANLSDSRKIYGNVGNSISSAIDATQNIIDFAKSKHSKKIIYLSSITACGLFGKTEDEGSLEVVVVDEDRTSAIDWRKSENAYFLIKRLSEMMLFNAHDEDKIPMVIIRPGFVFGYNILKDGRIFAQSIRDAVEGKKIEIYSDGKAERPSIYITDLIRGILISAVIETDEKTYNIPGRLISLKDYITELASISGVKATFGDANNSQSITDKRSTQFKYSDEKIRKIGWSERMTLHDALLCSYEMGKMYK